jgi:hypothetical protein
MFMKEEEIKELLAKYIILSPADNGRILVTAEASRIIADEYKINLAENERFSPQEISKFIIQKEDMKRAAAASIAAAKEKNTAVLPADEEVVFINPIEEIISRYDNYRNIAKAILEELPHLSESERKECAIQAEKAGLIESADDLIEMIKEVFQANSVFLRMKGLKFNIKDEDKLVDQISKLMITTYSAGIINFGRLRLMLNDSALELSEEMINTCVDNFYIQKQKDITSRYTNTELSSDGITHDILRNYDDLNVIYVVDALKMVDPPLEVDAITYLLYMNEDAKNVKLLFKNDKLSPEDILEELRDFALEYPNWCVEKTINGLRKEGLDIPFDEIYEAYCNSGRLELCGPEESDDFVKDPTNEVAAFDGEDFLEPSALLIPGQREISILPEDELIQDEPTRKRLRIVDRAKETEKTEKKITIATTMVAAGMLSTMIFGVLYFIPPSEAATNCFAVMEPLYNSIPGIPEMLPYKPAIIGIFAAAATSFIGTIKFLRNYLKKRKLGNKVDNEVVTEVIDVEDYEEIVERKGR